jgi:hypothetical protein
MLGSRSHRSQLSRALLDFTLTGLISRVFAGVFDNLELRRNDKIMRRLLKHLRVATALDLRGFRFDFSLCFTLFGDLFGDGNLPVTTSNLKKSKLGITLKELVQREDETLNNRKLCKDLINKWLALVLDQEQSLRRHRAQTQHEQVAIAEQVTKKRKTKAEIKAEAAEVQSRRHPQMFQKPSHNFVVAPQFEVVEDSRKNTRDESRKGKVKKCAGELRAMRPAAKHETVSISGNGINLTF